jgi:hypothetical protein
LRWKEDDMSTRSTFTVAAGGLILLAVVGVYEQRAVAAGQWNAPTQWSAVAPWMPVASIAQPPVPLAEELAAAARADALAEPGATPAQTSPGIPAETTADPPAAAAGTSSAAEATDGVRVAP